MWRGNANDQRLMRHVQAPFRHANGVILHPLQMQGAVGSTSHDQWPSGRAASGASMLDAPPVMAPVNMSLPQVVPLIGSPRDPRFMVA